MPKCPSHSGLMDSQAPYGDQLEPLFPQATPNDSSPPYKAQNRSTEPMFDSSSHEERQILEESRHQEPSRRSLLLKLASLTWHCHTEPQVRRSMVFNLQTQELSVFFEVHITEIPTVPKERNLVLQIYTHGLEYNGKLFPPFCLIPKPTMLR